jgi:hypothetical protein
MRLYANCLQGDSNLIVLCRALAELSGNLRCHQRCLVISAPSIFPDEECYMPWSTATNTPTSPKSCSCQIAHLPCPTSQAPPLTHPKPSRYSSSNTHRNSSTTRTPSHYSGSQVTRATKSTNVQTNWLAKDAASLKT